MTQIRHAIVSASNSVTLKLFIFMKKTLQGILLTRSVLVGWIFLLLLPHCFLQPVASCQHRQPITFLFQSKTIKYHTVLYFLYATQEYSM